MVRGQGGPRGLQARPFRALRLLPPGGAGVPNLFLRALRLGIWGKASHEGQNKQNGLNKVDFPRFAALLIRMGRHWGPAPLRSCQCPCSPRTLNPVMSALNGSRVTAGPAPPGCRHSPPCWHRQ